MEGYLVGLNDVGAYSNVRAGVEVSAKFGKTRAADLHHDPVSLLEKVARRTDLILNSSDGLGDYPLF